MTTSPSCGCRHCCVPLRASGGRCDIPVTTSSTNREKRPSHDPSSADDDADAFVEPRRPLFSKLADGRGLWPSFASDCTRNASGLSARFEAASSSDTSYSARSVRTSVNGAPSARSNGEKWMSFSPSASTASKWSGGASGSTHGASGGRSV